MSRDWSRLREELDRGRMWDILMQFPEDLERAWREAEELELEWEEPSKVLVAGMGGSAIGGDLAKEYAYDRARIPVEVVRDFEPPLYADRSTLAFVVSYSGKTEETLSTLSRLLDAGCAIVAVTSGGILGEVAAKKGLPVLEVPAGRPPRTALPYLYLPILVILSKLGVLEFDRGELEEAISMAREARRELFEGGETSRVAEELAERALGKIPLIYSYRPYYSVAYRFKTQINENAKQHAFCAEIPEMCHNEIVGWERGGSKYFPVFLRGREEDPRVRARVEYLVEVLEERGVGYGVVEARGEGRLSNQLSLLYAADVASYYLALLNGVDPTPIELISRMKKRVGGPHW